MLYLPNYDFYFHILELTFNIRQDTSIHYTVNPIHNRKNDKVYQLKITDSTVTTTETTECNYLKIWFNLYQTIYINLKQNTRLKVRSTTRNLNGLYNIHK